MAKNKANMNKFLTGAITATMVATAVAPVAGAASFGDLNNVDDGVKTEINKAEKAGFFKDAAKFNPAEKLNRSQAALTIARYIADATDVDGLKAYVEEKGLEESVTPFNDVPASFKNGNPTQVENYYASLIVKDAGAFTQDNLHLTNSLTRSQMAKVIVEAFGLTKSSSFESKITDIGHLDAGTIGYIETLEANGVTIVEKFNPAGNVTRAHMASFLVRAYEEVHGEIELEEEVETTELVVKSVSAITLTEVTVDITELTEDVEDANVVVKNLGGQVIPTKAKTIKAGSTTATFAFETPLTVSPSEGWTVNGVAYKPANFEIVNVEALTETNKYLSVQFNKPLKSLEASEVSIRNADTLERFGVEKVSLASDGLSAQITLLGDELTGNFVEAHQDYTLSITQNGVVDSATFNLDKVHTNRVTTIDKSANKIFGYTVSPDVTVDYEEIFGRTATYWTNKDGYITKINLKNEKVVYDAVNFVVENNKMYAETLTEGEKYLVDAGNVYEKNSNGGVTTKSIPVAGSDYDYEYTKLVFNNRGEVANVLGVTNFSSSILVEKNEKSVITGYGDEINLSSFTIVKDGKTIKASEIEKGDVVFFNNTVKFAEVYSNTVSGKIQASFDGEFRLNGKNYKHDGRYINNGKFDDVDVDAIDALKASDKEVTVYLNRAGEVSVITGELGEVVTSEVVSYLTDGAVGYELKGKDYLVLPTQTDEGTKVEYDFALENLEFIHEIEDDGTVTKYDVGATSKESGGNTTRITGFKFDPAPTPSSGTFTIKVTEKTTQDSDGSDASPDPAHGSKSWDQTDIKKGLVLEVVKNDKDEVVGLVFAKSHDLASSATIDVKEGDKVAKLDTVGDVQIKSSTPVFYKQGAQLVSTTYGKLDKNVIETITAATVYTDGSDALYINVTAFTGPSATNDFETVISAINSKNGKIAYLELMENGVSKEYPVNANISLGTLKVGDIVDVKVNKTTGKVTAIAPDAAPDTQQTGVVNTVSITNKTFKVDSTEYRIGDSGVNVYEIVNGKVEARNLHDLASIKGDNRATISTIGGTNVVDTIVIERNKDIVFTTTNSVHANNVSTLGLEGTTASSSNSSVVTVSFDNDDKDNVVIKSVGAGTANVSVQHGSNTATINVTVNAYGAITVNSITKYEAPGITSVTVSPSTATIDGIAGDTEQLTASVVVTGGAAQTVTWSIDKNDNGKVTVDANTGLVTVQAGATADTYTVTAESTVDGTKKGTATITVTN